MPFLCTWIWHCPLEHQESYPKEELFSISYKSYQLVTALLLRLGSILEYCVAWSCAAHLQVTTTTVSSKYNSHAVFWRQHFIPFFSIPWMLRFSLFNDAPWDLWVELIRMSHLEMSALWSLILNILASYTNRILLYGRASTVIISWHYFSALIKYAWYVIIAKGSQGK